MKMLLIAQRDEWMDGSETLRNQIENGFGVKSRYVKRVQTNVVAD